MEMPGKFFDYRCLRVKSETVLQLLYAVVLLNERHERVFVTNPFLRVLVVEVI